MSQGRSNVYKLRDIVNAKDPVYGAKGDDATDDYAALQAALDTGLDVYAPPGIYRHSQKLVMDTATAVGQTLRGAGALHPSGFGTSATIFQPTAAVTTEAILVGGDTGFAVQNFRLEDFTIDMVNMADASTSIGIRQNTAWNGSYTGVRVRNDGTAKRGWKFETGAYLTTLKECTARIFELAGISLGDAVTTLVFQNCDAQQYIARNAASITVLGGAVQGALDKFDLQDIRGWTNLGVDVEGTGVYWKIGTNVARICAIGTVLDGFTGTYMTGTLGQGYALFENFQNRIYGATYEVGGVTASLAMNATETIIDGTAHGAATWMITATENGNNAAWRTVAYVWTDTTNITIETQVSNLCDVTNTASAIQVRNLSATPVALRWRALRIG